jgi:hypothetical protein
VNRSDTQTLPSAVPEIDRPMRSGFTLELGLGVSLMEVMPQGGSSFTKVGLAPASLSLGGFFNNNFSLLFRIASTSFFSRNARGGSSKLCPGSLALTYNTG